jgi:hypothetical protein
MLMKSFGEMTSQLVARGRTLLLGLSTRFTGFEYERPRLLRGFAPLGRIGNETEEEMARASSAKPRATMTDSDRCIVALRIFSNRQCPAKGFTVQETGKVGCDEGRD